MVRTFRQRTLAIIIAFLAIASQASPVWAEFYRVEVTRRDSNLYQVHNTPYYIVTRYCYEYVYYESAILRYEPYSWDNKLIFDSGSDCEVERVIRGR